VMIEFVNLRLAFSPSSQLLLLFFNTASYAPVNFNSKKPCCKSD
jgi:hypothetical protein